MSIFSPLIQEADFRSLHSATERVRGIKEEVLRDVATGECFERVLLSAGHVDHVAYRKIWMPWWRLWFRRELHYRNEILLTGEAQLSGFRFGESIDRVTAHRLLPDLRRIATRDVGLCQLELHFSPKEHLYLEFAPSISNGGAFAYRPIRLRIPSMWKLGLAR